MNTVTTRVAEPADFGEIYTLQLAAFVDEARLYGTPDVPSVNDTFEQFMERLFKCDSWVGMDCTD